MNYYVNFLGRTGSNDFQLIWTAPRILIFSIVMGADYFFDVKTIEIWVPAFFKHINSSVATVITFNQLTYKPT